MADAPATVSSLNGLFKEVYPEGIKDLIPNGTKVQKRIPFIAASKELGKQYNQPVTLAYPNGYTFAAAGAGAFTLNDSNTGTMKNAALDGSQILLREQMDYESAAKSNRGRNAFMDGTKLMFKNMQLSMRKTLEVELLYGSMGLCTVLSYSNPTITVTTAEWAPGIWSGLEGRKVTVYEAATTTARGSTTIASVDIVNRTITLAADVSGTTTGDTVYFESAVSSEMSGIHKILSNTGSLFGISASTYSLWKSVSYSASSAALTFAKVRKAVALAVAKGLDDDCELYVNPKTWDNLMDDLAALRRINEKSGKSSSYSIGAEEIVFFSQNGKIAIVPSIYVKEGYAFGLCPEDWKRPGAQDVSFQTPGSMKDEIFFHLPTKAGFEVRAYTDQAVFCEAPGRQFVITGIVNA
jgi:hypothetical protein